jgi:hypothetical protein
MKNALLEQELTGTAPVLVTLGGKEYPLAYTLHAIILYKRETGDNLFRMSTWDKIDPLDDPERFLAALWAGLHQEQDDHSWKSPCTREELGKLVDFNNVGPLANAVLDTLLCYFPKVREKVKEATESPNGQAPETEKIPEPAGIEPAD